MSATATVPETALAATVDRAGFASALKHAASIIPSRSPQPVLQCVRLSADATGLVVEATNGEQDLRQLLESVDALTHGACLVPAAKLFQIVAESTDPTLSLTADGEYLTIKGADSRFKVNLYPLDQFPAPQPMPDAQLTIGAIQLDTLIKQTIFAVAQETSRYAINGVLWDIAGKSITAVATDGRRLAISTGACSGEEMETPIVPASAIGALARIMGKDDVEMAIDNGMIWFSGPGWSLRTAAIEGNFPPYKDVMPKDHNRSGKFNADALLAAVRRAALMTSEESKGVRFAFNGEHLTVTSRAPEMGEAEVTAPVENYTGEPLDIGFNPAFIADAIKASGADTVEMRLTAPNKPGVIRAGDFTCVVMPVSLE